MTDFLLCIGRYVVEMAVLALIGGLGHLLVSDSADTRMRRLTRRKNDFGGTGNEKELWRK